MAGSQRQPQQIAQLGVLGGRQPLERRLIDDARWLVEGGRQAGVPATLEITEEAVHAFPVRLRRHRRPGRPCSGWAGISRPTLSPVRAVIAAGTRGLGAPPSRARASKQAFCRLW
jgi:hypothetical protein